MNASFRSEYGLYQLVGRGGPEPRSVIGVSCFVIAPPFRRHGVASALLDRVIADASARGAVWIEAYPRNNPDESDAAHFRGPRSMYDARGFEPQTATSTFRVAASDYLDPLFLPQLMAQVRAQAPHCHVEIHPLSAALDYHAQLAQGEVDVVIGNWLQPPDDLHMGKLFADAKRFKHIARLKARRCAGRTRRNGDVADSHQQRFAFDIGEGNIQIARHPFGLMTIDVDFRYLVHNSATQPLAQSKYSF